MRVSKLGGGVDHGKDHDVVAWDDELRGFGVRFKPTGSGAYIIHHSIQKCRGTEQAAYAGIRD